MHSPEWQFRKMPVKLYDTCKLKPFTMRLIKHVKFLKRIFIVQYQSELFLFNHGCFYGLFLSNRAKSCRIVLYRRKILISSCTRHKNNYFDAFIPIKRI